MRIRNSRPSFRLPPVPPEAFLRSTHLGTCALHFDERFLVEEANRHIGWPCYPFQKLSSADIAKGEANDGLLPAIASGVKSLNHVENRSEKENCVPAMQSHVSQRPEEPGTDGRKSKFPATYGRDRKGYWPSTSIVLALGATSFQPEMELPIKKRRKCRLLRIERKKRRKEEATAIAEVKLDTTITPVKEGFIEHENCQMSTTVNCVLNCQSSFPSSSIYGAQGQQKDGEMFLMETAIVHEDKLKRKRGRPRKAKV